MGWNGSTKKGGGRPWNTAFRGRVVFFFLYAQSGSTLVSILRPTLSSKKSPVSIKVMWLFCNQLKQVRYLHWTVKLFRLFILLRRLLLRVSPTNPSIPPFQVPFPSKPSKPSIHPNHPMGWGYGGWDGGKRGGDTRNAANPIPSNPHPSKCHCPSMMGEMGMMMEMGWMGIREGGGAHGMGMG